MLEIAATAFSGDYLILKNLTYKKFSGTAHRKTHVLAKLKTRHRGTQRQGTNTGFVTAQTSHGFTVHALSVIQFKAIRAAQSFLYTFSRNLILNSISYYRPCRMVNVEIIYAFE